MLRITVKTVRTLGVEKFIKFECECNERIDF